MILRRYHDAKPDKPSDTASDDKATASEKKPTRRRKDGGA